MLRVLPVIALALAAALLPSLRFGPLAGIATFASVLVVGLAFTFRAPLRHARILRAPFPAEYRAILEKEVEPYRGLAPAERRRFEGEVAIFLAEQTITGPRGERIDDELRVLVAAAATILAFGRPGFRYPTTRDVVVYDDAFDAEYRVGAEAEDGAPLLGMVHGSGPILFSARSLREGFRNPRDARNVGLHEFAHVLDFAGGAADGVPSFMPWRAVRPWLGVMHAETTRIRAHHSILREYAATNDAEFFAVATEMFFEQPERMKQKHPELYRLLAATYGQDPAHVRPKA